MFEEKDPADPNFAVAHCHDPATLRKALAVLLARCARMRGDERLPPRTRDELSRMTWLISCLGIRPEDGPIGRDDDAFAARQGDGTGRGT